MTLEHGRRFQNTIFSLVRRTKLSIYLIIGTFILFVKFFVPLAHCIWKECVPDLPVRKYSERFKVDISNFNFVFIFEVVTITMFEWLITTFQTLIICCIILTIMTSIKTEHLYSRFHRRSQFLLLTFVVITLKFDRFLQA